jgi:membrane protease YdiL (CAAX protease family)
VTSAAVRLWGRIVAATAVAAVLFAAVDPQRPPSRVPPVGAVAVGVAAGAALALVLVRRLPRLRRRAPLVVVAAKHGFLGLWAANEEIVWRRVVLGELLAAGLVAALAGSTIGFALVHRARRGVHLGTGAVFGGVYLATGALAACVAAHWTYNALVAALGERTRPDGGPAP